MANKRMIVAATIVFSMVSGAPQLVGGDTPARANNSRQATAPSGHTKVSRNVMDYLGGLNLTDEQKAKIDQIQRKGKSQFGAINQDSEMDTDKKVAMLQGYRRLANAEVFDVLTPEQQTEVRKRFQNAKRQAAAEPQQQHAVPAPPK